MDKTVPPGKIAATVLGTCCIPWESPGQADMDRFRRTIRRLHEQGLRDLYIFGTAGEGHAVSERQFRVISEAFVEQMRDLGANPMIGVIGLPLATTVERLERVNAIGVTQAQISLPNWGALQDVEVETYFREICDQFPAIRFMHYNLGRSGRILEPDDYIQLTLAHPNLVATKYGAGHPETVSGLMQKVPQMTHFFTELGFYQGTALGSCGLLASVSSSNPTQAWRYFNAGKDGDTHLLAQLYAELSGVMVGIRDCVGHGSVATIRSDSLNCVPEPELALLVSPLGTICGFTICDDITARDLEAENPLYLPQAKIWLGSCALGPGIVPANEIADPYTLAVTLTVERGGRKVFYGSSTTARLNRRLDDLAIAALHDHPQPQGFLLTTGTPIVPPWEFTLALGDSVSISIDSVGTLTHSIGVNDTKFAA